MKTFQWSRCFKKIPLYHQKVKKKPNPSYWSKSDPNALERDLSKRSLTRWYMLRDEMDNEVSICCFYAVIRNCHTSFRFFISLALFACWNFLWSRIESIKLGPSCGDGRWLRAGLPTSGAGSKPEAGGVGRAVAELPPRLLFTAPRRAGQRTPRLRVGHCGALWLP